MGEGDSIGVSEAWDSPQSEREDSIDESENSTGPQVYWEGQESPQRGRGTL
jgi:hypothetical protein